MKKTAVIYWSGTGNTKQMAEAVLEGMKSAGADAALLEAAQVTLPPSAAWMPWPSDALLWVLRYWRKWSLSLCSPPARAI